MGAKLKIIFSMTVFGTLALFVKNIDLTAGEIALFRALIAAVSIIIYKLAVKEAIFPASIRKEIPILFVSGAAMAFNWIFLFKAYIHTSVSIATLSYYFAPVIVMVSSPLLFKETLSLKQVICFFMASAGLVMVIGVSGAGMNSGHLAGIGFGLCAAVFYAGVIILNKYIKSVTGIDRTLIQFFAAITILMPYLFFTTGISLGNLNAWGFANLFVLGLVHTGITYCLYFSSLKDLTGQEAAIFSYIDPLVAILISVMILNESMNLFQIMGGIMILGFTLLNEIQVKFWTTGKGVNEK
ncbi:MAG: DMT family transporter [Desulfobacter sp.]|nr:DMT family transporter [Desulfobacter sp.]WDP87005.1 MAG: DMT family transporter [Desulfobacter sp.]